MDRSVKLSRVIALVSIMFASCSNDELKEIYQGEEITFTTQVGRSIETKLETLDGFYVYADAPGAPMFIKGDTAKKEGSTNRYMFKNSYYWPQGVKEMKFWAYGPLGIIKKEQVDINEGNQSLANFTPAEDAENQKDLVVAYASVTNNVGGMAVELNFQHALSQIVIKAKCPGENKKVYVKGVWMVNVKGSGTLEFDAASDKNMSWSISGSEVDYGKTFEPGSNNRYTLLSSTKLTPLLDNETSSKSSLMLVPQKKDKLVINETDGTGTSGTYILLLCRVEAEHDGEFHTGEDSDGFVSSDAVNKKHIHQLFPTSTDGFKEGVYGYTCVPVDIDWQPGKKYVYNLEFCGHNSGAGIYPPKDLPTGLPEGGEVSPDNKWGKPVLDNPISFTVTVDDWTTEPDKNVDMQ